MAAERLNDNEIVYRRIPSSRPWLEPPDQITSANFKLNTKRAELGISVYRAAVVSGEEALRKEDATRDSLLAMATVGEIRSLVNGVQQLLNLDVIAVDDEGNPGHAEIRGPDPGKLSPAVSKALQRIFRLRN